MLNNYQVVAPSPIARETSRFGPDPSVTFVRFPSELLGPFNGGAYIHIE